MKQTRNTVAKSEILSLIKLSNIALSHAEIQSQLETSCDRVTIYRVLDRLLNEGEIHKIGTQEGVVKYAACNGCTTHHRHDHVHFNCVQCKTVTCLENVVPEFVLPKNYAVLETNFSISGICPNCAE